MHAWVEGQVPASPVPPISSQTFHLPVSVQLEGTEDFQQGCLVEFGVVGQ